MNALAATFPGQRIYVPWSNAEALARFTENFVPLIGVDAVDQLLDEFGGLRITVPTRRVPQYAMGSRGFPPISVEAVVQLTLQGLTATAIAARLRCDPRSVHKARTKARKLALLPPRAGARKSK